MADKKKCFVISPIGDDNSDIRNEANWVLKGLIEPALGDAFEIKRADAYPKNDVITNQVILAIRECDLVVADLSGLNPNVFYELAVAHSFEKRVIPMMRSGQRIPFDNHLMGTIMYSRDRIEDFERAKADLRHAADEAMKAGHQVSNPVTLALGVGQMKASGDTKEQLIAELADTVQRMARDVEQLKVRGTNVGTTRALSDDELVRAFIKHAPVKNHMELSNDEKAALKQFVDSLGEAPIRTFR